MPNTYLTLLQEFSTPRVHPEIEILGDRPYDVPSTLNTGGRPLPVIPWFMPPTTHTANQKTGFTQSTANHRTLFTQLTANRKTGFTQITANHKTFTHSTANHRKILFTQLTANQKTGFTHLAASTNTNQMSNCFFIGSTMSDEYAACDRYSNSSFTTETHPPTQSITQCKHQQQQYIVK